MFIKKLIPAVLLLALTTYACNTGHIECIYATGRCATECEVCTSADCASSNSQYGALASSECITIEEYNDRNQC